MSEKLIEELKERLKGKTYNFGKDLSKPEQDALLLASQNGDGEATRIIFHGVKNLISSIINRNCYNLLEYNIYDYDEILNILRHEFIRTIKNYDTNKGLFTTYLGDNLKGISKSLTKKAYDAGEFNKVSLDEPITGGSSESGDLTLAGTLSNEKLTGKSFGNDLLNKYAIELCLLRMPEFLKGLIVEVFFNEKSVAEVARENNTSRQAIDQKMKLALDLFTYIYKLDVSAPDFSRARTNVEVRAIKNTNDKLLEILKDTDFKIKIYPKLSVDERTIIKVFFPNFYNKIQDDIDISKFDYDDRLIVMFNKLLIKINKIKMKKEKNEQVVSGEIKFEYESVLEKIQKYGLVDYLTPTQREFFQKLFIEGKKLKELGSSGNLYCLKKILIDYEARKAKIDSLISSVGEEIIARDFYDKLDDVDKMILTDYILAYIPVRFEKIAEHFNMSQSTIRFREVNLRKAFDKFIRERKRNESYVHESKQDEKERIEIEVAKKCKEYGIYERLTSLQKKVFDLYFEQRYSLKDCEEKFNINNPYAIAYAIKKTVEEYEKQKREIESLISSAGGEEGMAKFFDTLDDIEKIILTEVILSDHPLTYDEIKIKYDITMRKNNLSYKKVILQNKLEIFIANKQYE